MILKNKLISDSVWKEEQIHTAVHQFGAFCDDNLVEMFGLQNAAKITYEMTDLRNNPDYIRSDLGLG